MNAGFGTRPRASMITPPAVHTQRLNTPVTPTRPIFCEYETYGNVLRRPPIKVPGEFARNPRLTSSGPTSRPWSAALSPGLRDIRKSSHYEQANSFHSIRLAPIAAAGDLQ
jgi:hypothetical protein